MKKTLKQKKKELFQLLVKYYETKPEDSWCVESYDNGFGCHCAIGHIKQDFGDISDTVSTVRRIVMESPFSLICVNDGNAYMYQQPTPKQRVLAYLNDEINK